MPFQLPELKYSYNSLEPHIDAKTMEIHHTKHHAAYITNLNKALEKYPDLANKSVEDLIKDLKGIPEDIRIAIKNNGGGHLNHSMFWEIMSPKGGGNPVGNLAEEIAKTFTNFETFKKEFAKAAMGRFGSGWAWLILDTNKKLSIVSTANQDNPLTDGNMPIIGLDVWEHAYYLNYQNKRADYVTAWWNVVDWISIENSYKKVL